MQNSPNWIWGLHSIEACLQNFPEIILELNLQKNADEGIRSRVKALAKGLKIIEVAQLPKVLAEKRHQGVAAIIRKFPMESFAESDLTDAYFEATPHMALLDRVQDPRNFGAILRSAAAFGVKRVYVGSRNQAPLSGVVAQASAGNLFRIEVVEIRKSLADFVSRLREEAILTVGLDAKGEGIEEAFAKIRKEVPGGKPRGLLWVLGSEGEGLREGLEAKCERRLSIPMEADIESLNVSTAATLAFYLGRKFFV